jgi:hypothetical protein
MNQSRQLIDTFLALSNLKSHVVFGLLNKHGREWETSEYLGGGKKQQCFENAFMFALAHGWHYAEGYAVAGDLIPLQHAWCVKKDGSIVDPTWDDGHDYFGLAFHRVFVAQHILRTGTYGVLDGLHVLKKSRKALSSYLKSGLLPHLM